MSSNKFASNVVEKTIACWAHDYIEDIFTIIQEPHPEKNLPIILVLMQDNYANYVMQKLFEFGDENIKKRIHAFLKSCDPEEIASNDYSKHVWGSIEKLVLKGFDAPPSGALQNKLAPGARADGHKSPKKRMKQNKKK
jgi:hypothetical protein